MQAYLIDPKLEQCSIIEDEFDSRTAWKTIAKHLECQYVQRVRIGAQTYVWVDEEGLLKPNPGPFFQLPEYPEPLCGRGLILSEREVWKNNESDTEFVSPTNFDHLRTTVQFPKIEFIGFNNFQRGNTFVIEAKYRPLPNPIKSDSLPEGY